MNDDGNFDPTEDERRSRMTRRSGPAIDLTGLGIRAIASIVLIGLGAVAFLWIMQLIQGEPPPEVVAPPVEPTADLAQPLATFTAGPTSTPPPQDIPPTETPEVPAGTLAAGAAATVDGTGGSGANLRSSPELANNIVRLLSDGTAVTVLEGPTEAAGFVWWKIRTAEGDGG